MATETDISYQEDEQIVSHDATKGNFQIFNSPFSAEELKGS